MNLGVSKVIISRKGSKPRVVDVGNGRESTSEWVSFAHRCGWKWELRDGELRIEEGRVPAPATSGGRSKRGRA